MGRNICGTFVNNEIRKGVLGLVLLLVVNGLWRCDSYEEDFSGERSFLRGQTRCQFYKLVHKSKRETRRKRTLCENRLIRGIVVRIIALSWTRISMYTIAYYGKSKGEFRDCYCTYAVCVVRYTHPRKQKEYYILQEVPLAQL